MTEGRSIAAQVAISAAIGFGVGAFGGLARSGRADVALLGGAISAVLIGTTRFAWLYWQASKPPDREDPSPPDLHATLLEMTVALELSAREKLDAAIAEVHGEAPGSHVRRVATVVRGLADAWARAGLRVSESPPGRVEVAYRDAVARADSSALGAASGEGVLVVLAWVVSLSGLDLEPTDSPSKLATVVAALESCDDSDVEASHAKLVRTTPDLLNTRFPGAADWARGGPFRK